MELEPSMDTDKIFATVKAHYSEYPVSDIDGIKIDLPDRWVQLRKSNTEPIVRIYSEAKTMKDAEAIADEVIEIIKSV